MLPLYKKILVATDFSAHSTMAFKHAVMLARHNNAQIQLLHVMQPLDPYFRSLFSDQPGSEMIAELEKSKYQQLQQELQQELADFARTELADFPEDLQRFNGAEVVIGTPATEIVATADQNNVDVIVLGTHGRGFIEHALLGSVAEKVLRHASRPVLVIPLPA
ncbi:universal stress protein [Pelobacter seleniigenes]|uniref:universal stress protein n=1 Tax=Pelobacter seleniigenes TaxID=407188 RepID=UPI0004A759B9|nr:universal stress protein [Pelobacter seleniigenes]